MKDLTVEEFTQHMNNFKKATKRHLIPAKSFAYFDESKYYQVFFPDYVHRESEMKEIQINLSSINRKIVYMQQEMVLGETDATIETLDKLDLEYDTYIDEMNKYKNDTLEQILISKYQKTLNGLIMERDEIDADIATIFESRKLLHTYTPNTYDSYDEWYEKWEGTTNETEWTEYIVNLDILMKKNKVLNDKIHLQTLKLNTVHGKSWIMTTVPTYRKITASTFTKLSK